MTPHTSHMEPQLNAIHWLTHTLFSPNPDLLSDLILLVIDPSTGFCLSVLRGT